MSEPSVAVITDIHGNLPALEAALAGSTSWELSGSIAAATWSATAPGRTRSAG